MKFDAFVDDLKMTHGKNLASVILYGWAAAGDSAARQTDYKLLVALHRITPQDLRNANACMREWKKTGHSVPTYFTVSELQNAADVFPIEFYNMERARKVLYGADVLANLNISDEYLRHQTEFELRSKFIRLRREYIPASASVEGLVNLMTKSLSSFAALFRAVLIITGVEPPVTKHEIIALTVEHLKIDGSSFVKILNMRENNFAKPLNEVEANRIFGDYMEQIENVIEIVDKMEKS